MRFPRAAVVCKRYRKQCCLARQALANDTLASFRYRANAESKEVLLVCLLPDAEVPLQQPTHTCPTCAKLFRSRSAMASHVQKVHGQQAPATTQAGARHVTCLNEYWSTGRLRDHLRHQPQCLATYVQADLPFSDAHELTPDGSVFRPSTTLVGPQPFWATLRPAPQPLAHEHHGVDPLHDAFVHAMQQTQGCSAPSQVFTSLAPKLYRLCEVPDEAELLLDEFLVTQPLAQYMCQLCVALCQLTRTKCSQPLQGGSLRVLHRWLFWVPDEVQFCPERAGLEA